MDLNQRFIYINDELENREFNFPNNKIHIHTYSVLHFLKRFLWHNTFRLGYIYLLLITILQLIPSLSTIGTFTTLGPLLVMVVATFVLQLLTTIQQQRHLDRDVNLKKVSILRGAVFNDVASYKLKPGDVIKVSNNEYIPADLMLLATSDMDNVCMVEQYETADGEVKLSSKSALEFTSTLKDPRSLAELDAKISCSEPGTLPSNFRGQMLHDRVTENIGFQHFVTRGAKITNTKWVYGCVIYTGHHSLVPALEIEGLSTNKKTKLGRVERMTNYFLFSLLSISVLLAAISTIVYRTKMDYDTWYLDLSSMTVATMFFTFIILYNGLIAITLYFTIDIIKLINMTFVNEDIAGSRQFPKSSTLIDELGQVAYLFSDKTGTLTQNQMVLKKCSIGGTVHLVDNLAAPGHQMEPMSNNNGETTMKLFPVDEALYQSNQTRMDYFMAIMTCHTVCTEDGDQGEVFYKGSSMDELALLKGALSNGYKLHKRVNNFLSISIQGQSYEFQVVEIIGFTSSRRRMSVIVRNPINNQVMLYMKGADEEIFLRLAPKQPFADKTITDLENFGKEGLRTLCVAQKILKEETVVRWVNDYRAAKSTSNADAIRALEAEMESNLTLLGATAVDDKLQEGVPETIHTLRSSGIKMWVLTGDKLLTAMNVGASCRLIDESTMEILVLAENSENECVSMLNEYLATATEKRNKKDIALVFSGTNLEYLLSNPTTKLQFLKLAENCNVAIGFRLSPNQKSSVINLVKNNIQDVTLAIGDGSNDIGMIDNADIGVGIIGHEGIQAAQTADYSLSEFRLLERLLLLHGRNAYQRVTSFILYIMNKSATLVFTQFWYTIYTLSSGSTLYDPTTIVLYSFLFTLFPAIALGVFNRAVGTGNTNTFPELYQDGPMLAHFNFRMFFFTILSALYQSLCIFFVPVLSMNRGIIYGDGHNIDEFYMGVLVFTCLVFTVNFKVALETLTWTWVSIVAFLGSLILYFGWTLIACSFGIGGDWYNIDLLSSLYSSGYFYLNVILVVIVALYPEYVIKYVHRSYYPNMKDVVQEMERKKRD
ncbi:hypothetical protein SAMD00019534_110750 [Acytostelium subglobosum LB1]|uniref:hypothetical protein n=1 Tax=Acytostelium subglobosum LB1 TaxID=1410327 RepID=UPI0006451915|nr:hypothetical protein SAMD00019534_110750 [Acytostelium subglobosum LB1]GAM27899.1 hypothetical protein SAMD00019534_110750 [Acytostelium subglobosum LB1]|eukprot:XP_012749182.1 hypothetical protein SAMD00019534_110750 [Acytostelium subglobosum LB1]